jgi:hypothetical protein
MRIHKLTPIVVSLVVLAAITATVVRFRSVKAQQDRAARAPIPAKAALQQIEGNGLNPTPGAETRLETGMDLYLDADEVERRAREEQGSGAAATSPIPISFKHVRLPVEGGIDHAVAGVATRNSGQGVIRLRGVPPGSQLLGALLVWGEIAPPPAANPYEVLFAQDCATPAVVKGTPAPFPFNPAIQPCWNPAGQFFAYIADVTAQIASGINGDYRISRLRTSVRDGRCPWPDAACAPAGNELPLSEGASLIVFYANQCITRKAQIYLHLGPQMFSGPHVVTHAAAVPINSGLPNLKHSRIGADGQVGVSNCGLRSIPQGSDERTWIENPVTGVSIQIKGDGGGLNRDSDFNGYDGEPLNKLWDTHTDVFSESDFLAKGGGGSYRVRYLSQGDCVVWVAHILGVR